MNGYITDETGNPIKSSNPFPVEHQGAIPAGTNVIGKVEIDQTTPGTTNGVQVVASIPAGDNNIGNVDVSSLPAGTVAGSESLPAGTNKIGRVDVASLPAEWTVTGTSEANTAQTITKAAEANKRHIITGYLVVLRAAAAGSDVGVALKDDATVKIQDYIGNAAVSGTRVIATGLRIAMSTNAAANLVVDAAGASAITELTMWGYTEDV